ncbi:hypothetical protein SAMN05660236_1351 [Ohtaekwangia koreensis]|uniref:Uncharacterized protein n=1 Tax=Ohtaekwangia koreensis TaxID=688867 RepID=A0A1T5JQI6_9BACT|nr:hypothetical protein SAMN05660236_1351 [Ohtaekwangia koreensis]
MKSITSILLMTFEKEFTKLHNAIGWLITSTIWLTTNIEKINNLLTALLTLCSIIWVVVKIILAIKNKRNDSDQ